MLNGMVRTSETKRLLGSSLWDYGMGSRWMKNEIVFCVASKEVIPNRVQAHYETRVIIPSVPQSKMNG